MMTNEEIGAQISALADQYLVTVEQLLAAAAGIAQLASAGIHPEDVPDKIWAMHPRLAKQHNPQYGEYEMWDTIRAAINMLEDMRPPLIGMSEGGG